MNRIPSALRIDRPVRRALKRAVARRADRRLHSFYRRFIQPGDLVFDVGANLGNRTAVFRRLGARVVAVDPQPGCVRELRNRFGADPGVILEPVALGSTEGTAEMLVASHHTLSSLSREWIERVRESGRFVDYSWDERVQVKVMTLDQLIDRHGEPGFCKIDVEGFEMEVLRGLTRPLQAVSLEFAPEYADGTLSCIGHLRELGDYEFNLSEGESMRLTHQKWRDPEAMVLEIRRYPRDIGRFADIYARLRAGGPMGPSS